VKTYLRTAEATIEGLSRKPESLTGDEEVSNSEALLSMIRKDTADLSIRDKYGNSILLLSCLCGHANVLDFLLQQQHTLEMEDLLHDTNHKGMTAVHCASKGGNLAMIQRLVEREGLDLHVQDKNGWTLLHWACFAAPNVTDSMGDGGGSGGDDEVKASGSGNNNRHDIEDDHPKVIAWLLHHGLDPLEVNDDGETPLHVAIRSMDRDAIRLLVVKLVLHRNS